MLVPLVAGLVLATAGCEPGTDDELAPAPTRTVTASPSQSAPPAPATIPVGPGRRLTGRRRLGPGQRAARRWSGGRPRTHRRRGLRGGAWRSLRPGRGGGVVHRPFPPSGHRPDRRQRPAGQRGRPLPGGPRHAVRRRSSSRATTPGPVGRSGETWIPSRRRNDGRVRAGSRSRPPPAPSRWWTPRPARPSASPVRRAPSSSGRGRGTRCSTAWAGRLEAPGPWSAATPSPDSAGPWVASPGRHRSSSESVSRTSRRGTSRPAGAPQDPRPARLG